MTPWVTRLLIANVAVYFLIPVGSPLWYRLMLIPQAVVAQPWGVITYMFLHGSFTHLLFNMIGLFFFGPRLEALLGSRDFLRLYFLSGLGGAILSFFFAFGASVVGASGAVFGILLAFALFFPRERIYLWGVLPVEARFLAIFLAVTSLFSGITGAGAGTAHFAHLGGFAGGWLFLRWRKRKRKPRRVEAANSQYKPAPGSADFESRKAWEKINLDELHELNRFEVEKLLGKLRESGIRSLSPDERAFLDRMVRR